MSRWKAAAIHLSISVVIGLGVLALLFWVWYPAPYFSISGGEHLTLTLLGVDLVMGPLLTLVVFKPGKRGLELDLSVIAILQVSALLYGLHVIAAARPAFIVGAVDRFVVVAANEIEPADLAAATDENYSSLPWSGPRLVAARVPTDAQERSDLVFSALAGRDLQNQPRYYVPYGTEAPTLLERACPLDALRASGPHADAIITDWLGRNGEPDPASVVWLPLDAHNASATMLLEKRSGLTIGALEIDPPAEITRSCHS